MNISYNWLKQYIDINLPVEEVGKILTSIGLEVEGIEKYESIKGGLQGFVIGEVLTCSKHPNADKLSVTTVSIGNNMVLPIVCGAPNVASGQKVVVATVGTTIYKGNESFTIQKAKIRGEVSEGMICAEDEIGIGNDHAGILVLDAKVVPGTPAKDYFKIVTDEVLVIGLTPNRIDAASHYGVARDLAAYLGLRGKVNLKSPANTTFKTDNSSRTIPVIVENSEACPRYTGVTISGVEVKSSPEWLQSHLKSIGLNPINNVVDITNYILHDLGQPLHAFDADKIKGNKVIVKTLPENTRFLTLDSAERTLSSNDLMICNDSEGMCIAGVFGGIESGVSTQTKNIFLESAYFNPVWVRRTSKRLQINTDSSFRFERGTDPNMTTVALKKAAMLIKEIAGGSITSDVMDVYPNPIKNFEIDLKYKTVDQLIGKTIERDKIKTILLGLGIQINNENSDGLKLLVPPFKVDVQREADVIEEILRIYGYNNIEFSETVHSTLSYSEKPDKTEVINLISDWLSSNGFNEILANSLTKSNYYENLETYKSENLVHIVNPLSQDLNVMRQTLLFGGLESVSHNINRKNSDLKLYEVGNIYRKETENKNQVLKGFTEELHISLIITGLKQSPNWISKEQPSNFYFLKSYVESVLKRVGVDYEKLQVNEVSNDIFQEGITYLTNNQFVVTLGLLNKKVTQLCDIKVPVYYAEINWDVVLNLIKNNKIAFEDLPRFPEVKRDLSMVLNSEIKFEQLKNLAHKTELKILKKVNLFDVYQGDKIEKGRKSYAVSFYLQDLEKTLTDDQIDKIMNNLVRVFEKELGAQIRM